MLLKSNFWDFIMHSTIILQFYYIDRYIWHNLCILLPIFQCILILYIYKKYNKIEGDENIEELDLIKKLRIWRKC